MNYLKTVRLAAGLIAGGISSYAVAQVPYLTFGSVSSVTVKPGDQFVVNLYVVVPSASADFSGELVAANYWLGTDAAGKGKFSVLGRTFENGFSVANGVPSWPEVLSTPNPASSSQFITPNDLGANVGGGAPLSPGTHLLSKLTVKVDASTPSAPTGLSYPLFTTTIDGFGWVDTTFPVGTEARFNPQASLTVSVVPEPSQFAIIAGLSLLGFAAYRRFSQGQGKV